MTPTQKVTNALFTLNQWLMPLLTCCILPWGAWATASILGIQSNERNESCATEADVLRLRSEISGVIAQLPPEEWRKRIIDLEKINGGNAIQLAKIETLLQDVRERVIRLDDQHRLDPKSIPGK